MWVESQHMVRNSTLRESLKHQPEWHIEKVLLGTDESSFEVYKKTAPYRTIYALLDCVLIVFHAYSLIIYVKCIICIFTFKIH